MVLAATRNYYLLVKALAGVAVGVAVGVAEEVAGNNLAVDSLAEESPAEETLAEVVTAVGWVQQVDFAAHTENQGSYSCHYTYATLACKG